MIVFLCFQSMNLIFVAGKKKLDDRESSNDGENGKNKKLDIFFRKTRFSPESRKHTF